VAQKLRTRSITGENQFTDSVELVGYFNVSISGEWAGTVTCQRSFDLGSTWFDVRQWTENSQEYGFEPERVVYYRIGCKSGDFSEGEIVLRISQ
jgi:hypothetical protein